MKLRLPITFSQFMWAMPLTGLLILGVGAGLELFLHVHIVLLTLVGLGIAGGVIGVVIQFGMLHLYLKCAVCGSFGKLTFGYQQGFSDARPLFDCPRCKRLVIKWRFGHMIGQEQEGVCPNCGYEFKTGEQVCPLCPKRSETTE
jgi:hypothetical protein